MAKQQKISDAYPLQGNADVPLNKLVEWPNNPRKTRNQLGLDSTAASLNTNGQLMPVLVRRIEGQDLFHVIDGERRRQCWNVNVDKGLMQADAEVRTFILDPSTPEADLIAIATIANVEREQMNPIEEMEAYVAMRRSGLKERQIAEQFNITPQQVRQRVSLGDLVEGARDLIRSGKRQLRWAQMMTIGSEAQQERIVAEINANPQAYVDGHAVQMEMTRGNIPVSSALFDPTELADCIARNLFETTDEGSFKDVERFWKRQDEEIQKLVAEHEATHSRVDLYKGRRFNDAGWMRGGEPEDSVAVIVVKDDGSVTVHTGMVAPGGYYEEKGDEGDVFADAPAMFGSDLEEMIVDEDDGAPTRSEPVRAFDPMLSATKATEAYLEGQIVAGLRLRAARDVRVSMAFVIAQTLTRHGKLASSMEISGFNLDPELRTSNVFQKLEARRASFDAILRNSGLLGVRSPSKAVELLLDLADEQIFELFSWSVSQSVNPGLTSIAFETMEVLEERPMDGWTIDQTYIETLSNAQKRALAEQVVPIATQPNRNASIPVVVRSIIASVEADALQGDWTDGDEGWLPPQITSLRAQAVKSMDDEAQAAQKRLDDDALAARAKAA